MTKEGPTNSEVKHLSDSNEENLVVLIDIKDYSLANCSSSSSSDSAESIEITPVNSPDTSDSQNELSVPAWTCVTGSRNTFKKTFKHSGGNYHVAKYLSEKDPIDFYNFFIDDEVITLIVTETNRYASQNLKSWSYTDNVEMRKFIGIILWMGLVCFPKIQDYWSNNILYENNISKTMARSRFEHLLNNIHFCDSMQRDRDDKLYKISTILDMINKKFQEAYTPEEEVSINESSLCFHEHMCGIKLCATGGYTWRYKVYPGKEDGVSAKEKVVLELMDGLLDSGRTLYTNNRYTSVSLAQKLINRDTHLVGTLRSNSKSIPKQVIQKKLKKGELISLQNEYKIVVLKWRGKRDVLMLSTKHDKSMIKLTIKGKEISKPSIVIDYNKGKAFVDLLNQLTTTSPLFQRNIKWYKQLVFHLISVTTLVNAHYLYKKVTNKNMKLTKFRELLIQAMVATDSLQPIPSLSMFPEQCLLKEVEGQKRQTRRRCSNCYKRLSLTNGSAFASKRAKKVNTICEKCKIPMCLDCFQKYHQNVP